MLSNRLGQYMQCTCKLVRLPLGATARTLALATVAMLVPDHAISQTKRHLSEVLRIGSADFMHGEWITSLAFSPGGKRIASGGDRSQVVKIWDVESGRLIRSYKGIESNVKKIAFKDEDVIGLLTTQGEFALLHADKDRLVYRGTIPNATTMLRSSDSFYICGWEITRLKDSGDKQVFDVRDPDDVYLTDMAISEKHKLLLACGNGNMYFYSTETGNRIAKMRAPKAPISKVCLSNTADLFAVASEDSFYCYELQTKKLVYQKPFSVNSDIVSSQDGQFVFGTIQKETIAVDEKTGRTTNSLPYGIGVADGLAVSGNLIATGGYSKLINLWSLKTMHPRGQFHFHEPPRALLTTEKNAFLLFNTYQAGLWRATGAEPTWRYPLRSPELIRNAALSPSSRQAIFLSGKPLLDDAANFRNYPTGVSVVDFGRESIARTQIDSDYVTRSVWLSDTKALLSGTKSNYEFDVETMKAKRIDLAGTPVFCRGGVIGVGLGNSVGLIDQASFQRIDKVDGEIMEVASAKWAFLTRGALVIGADLQMRGLTVIAELKEPVEAMRVSHSAEVLFVRGKSISHFCLLKAPAERAELKEMNNFVLDGAFTDDKLFVGFTKDGEVQLIDPKSCAVMSSLKELTPNHVIALADARVIVISKDQTVRLLSTK